MNNDQYQNPLDILNHNGNDSIMQAVYKYVTTVYKEQDSIIESHIRKIGGTEFEEITIDRDKVIEALTMYRDKDLYEKIQHGRWIGKPISGYSNCRCSVCNSVCEIHAIAGRATQKYCPNCGARMDEEERE